MIALYIFLILIILLGVCGIVYISFYNKMQFLRTKIEQAEGIIDETLRERYDMIVRTNDIVMNCLVDGKEYFKEYIALKNKNLSNFEVDRKLKEGFHLLSKLRDDYPELQTNKELKEILSNIKKSNEKITAMTSYYNRNTNELNGYVRKFPSNFIAKVHKLQVKPFFDGKDMNDDIYDDFKLK